MGVTGNKKSSYEEGSLDQYLRDISAYPLISRDEEVRLAQEIRKGDQECLDKLVRSNLRFVVSVAKKYQNQGVSLSDLINEGNLGLIRAAHKFDETKGIKFISYAVFCLKKKIRAWRLVFESHPALRTSFHWDGLDKPLQVVHQNVTPPAHREDWS